MRKDEIKKVVKEGYANIAKQGSPCCKPVDSCCGTQNVAENISRNIGYTKEELKAVPEGANLGLGCGNPVALASLRQGETVLDLGSGAGFDCFLAANKVGENGKVIGVDMTPEMIERAKTNAVKGGYRNTEFRLGEIENLPVDSNAVDAVISNCVINLSPEKEKVFQEALRVLKPGGRIMISDIVLLKELPAAVKKSVEAYIGCLSGAIMKDQYLKAISRAGFKDISIIEETSYPVDLMANDPTAQAVIESFDIPLETLNDLTDAVISIKVSAVKPSGSCCSR